MYMFVLIYIFFHVPPVKVYKVTTGETFGADEDLLKQMTVGLHVKFTSPEESDVIIVFCPISSRVGSDVDAAMREVSDDKKIILVVMHHTRDVDYSTGGRRWSETFRNVVLDVDVLFHETVPGLLICDENRKAVRQIQDALAQYNNSIGISDNNGNWFPRQLWKRLLPETQTESVSDSSSKAPAQDSDGSAAPAQDSAGSAAPAQDSAGSAAPVQDPAGSAAPSQDSAGSAAPAQDSAGSAAPAQDSAGSAAPAQDPAGSAAPSQDSAGSAAPAQDSPGSAAPPLDSAGSAAPPLDSVT
ncbi:mucin-1-like isoform X2 [Cololabis saira]|uniref:mucin-1-like isoform X2 n=1 Tax=Cololabis saira TaxID=129043 RepID=UPI002AD565CB|nr:mucin-1-like isoform X2 [Cololabis saira]